MKRRYQGAWLLVDNGYLAWPTTVPPIKSTSSQREIRFSRWLESMRKDVECTFGILKGRWRILKTGICLGGVEKADKIFLTCCALHNWLLDVDGLSAPWEGAVSTNTVEDEDEVMGGWDGEMGQHDEEDFGVLPAAIRDLNNPVAMRNYDQSGMGPDDAPSTFCSRRLVSNQIDLVSSSCLTRRRMPKHSQYYPFSG